jgi:hypothetical protein
MAEVRQHSTEAPSTLCKYITHHVRRMHTTRIATTAAVLTTRDR